MAFWPAFRRPNRHLFPARSQLTQTQTHRRTLPNRSGTHKKIACTHMLCWHGTRDTHDATHSLCSHASMVNRRACRSMLLLLCSIHMHLYSIHMHVHSIHMHVHSTHMHVHSTHMHVYSIHTCYSRQHCDKHGPGTAAETACCKHRQCPDSFESKHTPDNEKQTHTRQREANTFLAPLYPLGRQPLTCMHWVDCHSTPTTTRHTHTHTHTGIGTRRDVAGGVDDGKGPDAKDLTGVDDL